MTFDEQLFLIANGHHTAFMDMLMKYNTSSRVWIPFYIALFAGLVYKYGWKKSLYMLLFIGMAIGAADYICASIIRPAFQQMRPSNPDNPFSQYVTLVNGYRSGPYGIPSCHASNCFALASSLIIFTRSRWIMIVMPIWALFICYTRLYMGVHYPSDLLVGTAVGITLGSSFAMLGLTIARRIEWLKANGGYPNIKLRYNNIIGPYGISLNIGPVAIPMAALLITLLVGFIIAW